jgi:peptidoglycan/LPS O-acetylase OafA/YrhL
MKANLNLIPMRITPGLSIYLDFVRFMAAFVVVLHHTWGLVFPQFPLPWPGHAAVVIFFVLSGFVISHSASRSGQTGGEYFRHRFARLLPVSIAALLLSISIAPLVGTSTTQYAGEMQMTPEQFWKHIGINFMFLGQIWGWDVAPPYNPPFWSLNYEVWYYALFGIWIFTPKRWRALAISVTVLIVGYKVLLLLPVWLLGVALHRWPIKIGKAKAKSLFVTTIVLGLAFIWFDVSVLIRTHMYSAWPAGMNMAQSANQFVGDFLLGLIVAANFVSAASLNTVLNPPPFLTSAVRYLSSFTFSTYLFHMPLTVLIWNALKVRTPIGFYALVALGLFCLGMITEKRTAFYRKLFDIRASKTLLQSFLPGTKRARGKG